MKCEDSKTGERAKTVDIDVILKEVKQKGLV
jgi:hypothetical protein